MGELGVSKESKMFHKILVPLDGSELAERALKPALKLSKAAKGELLLLSISYLKHAFVEERAGIGFLLPHQSIDQTRQELATYLQSIAEKSAQPEVLLRTRARDGEPGLYHCIVRYQLGKRWYRDDPSARLGMNGTIPPEIRTRWADALEGHTWRTV